MLNKWKTRNNVYQIFLKFQNFFKYFCCLICSGECRIIMILNCDHNLIIKFKKYNNFIYLIHDMLNKL